MVLQACDDGDDVFVIDTDNSCIVMRKRRVDVGFNVHDTLARLNDETDML